MQPITFPSALKTIGKLPAATPLQKTSAAPTESVALPPDFDLIVEERPLTSLSCNGIAAPQALTTETLQEVYDKLEKLAENLRHTSQEIADADDDALFDLYALMRLLTQVAQEQRNSARALRKSASAQARLSLQEQADLQRSAAYTGLTLGLTACAISASMQVGNVALSSTAYAKQKRVSDRMGLPEAQRAYANEVKLTGSPEALNRAEVDADKVLRKHLGEADAAAFKTNLTDAPRVAEAREQLTAARARLNSVRADALDRPHSAVTQEALTHATNDYRDACDNYRSALQMQTDYYTEIAQTAPEATVASAQAKAESARLYQRQQCASLPDATPESPAIRRFNLIQAAVQHDPTFKRWATLSTVSQSVTQATATAGQALNVTAQSLSQLQNVSATEAATAAAKSRAAAETVDAIFKQEAEIISSVLEMMRNILAVENQSMETILRA